MLLASSRNECAVIAVVLLILLGFSGAGCAEESTNQETVSESPISNMNVKMSDTPAIAQDDGAGGAVYRYLEGLVGTSGGETVFALLWSGGWGVGVAGNLEGGWNVTFTFSIWGDGDQPPLPDVDSFTFSDGDDHLYEYKMNWKVSDDLSDVAPVDSNARALETVLKSG